MKILIVGSGGREKAIEKFLMTTQDLQVDFATELSKTEIAKLKDEYSLVIIGPEAPLVDGLADQLREMNIPTFGPGKAAAMLEGSKIFSKQFMIEARVQTSAYTVVDSVPSLRAALHGQTEFKNRSEGFELTPPYVLKADGLASGKGVFICDTEDELIGRGQDLFDLQILGQAGSKALLEEFKKGYELSVLLFTNGKDYEIMPIAQDHKRLLDGNRGPNTGGMGTYAPMVVDENLMKKIKQKVIEPTIRHIDKKGWTYNGVIFIGLIIQDGEPYTLEYNTRFGDPETQVILPLIKNDPLELFQGIAAGKLPKLQLHEERHACCVVLAAENYPDNPVKGTEIHGIPAVQISDKHYVLHAGTKLMNEKVTTNGGRVLNVIGIGDSKDSAIKNAYALAEKISWKGMQYRRDIGLGDHEN